MVIYAGIYLQVLKFIEADAAVKELLEILKGLHQRFLPRRFFFNWFTWDKNLADIFLVNRELEFQFLQLI